MEDAIGVEIAAPQSRRILVTGVFDLLHAGHIGLLRKASLDGQLIVGLLTDELATSYKRAPIMSFKERAEAIRATGLATYIVPKPQHPVLQLAVTLEIDWIYAGSDWTWERYSALNALTNDNLANFSIGFKVVDSGSEMTTSKIINRIVGYYG